MSIHFLYRQFAADPLLYYQDLTKSTNDSIPEHQYSRFQSPLFVLVDGKYNLQPIWLNSLISMSRRWSFKASYCFCKFSVTFWFTHIMCKNLSADLVILHWAMKWKTNLHHPHVMIQLWFHSFFSGLFIRYVVHMLRNIFAKGMVGK